MTLEESLKGSIRSVIKEELSINSYVLSKSSEIVGKICKDIYENFKENAIAVKPGIKRYKSNFVEFLEYNGNHKLYVKVNYFHFATNNIYDANKYSINCDYATSFSMKGIYDITVYCYGIGGTVNKAVVQSNVQHELEHIFQEMSGSKKIGEFDEVYALAQKNLFSEDKATMYASNLIYYSYAFEQDGYVNSLYAELIDKDEPMPRWEDIKDTSAYVALSMIRKALRVVEKNKSNNKILNAVQQYGFAVEDLLKQGKTAEKRLLTKIGKVLIKIRKDKEAQGIKFECTNPKFLPYFID